MESTDLEPRDPAAVLADLAADAAVAGRITDATVETRHKEVYVNTEKRRFFPTENFRTEQLCVSEHADRLADAVPLTDRYQPEHVPTEYTRLRVDVCDASPPQIDCPVCEDSTGTQTCPDCAGTTWTPCGCTDGRAPCQQCHGTNERPCEACSGEGTRQCDACSGSGADTCSQCGTTGTVPCRCQNGSVSGLASGTTGAVSCPTCGGDAERECRSCDGRGNKRCQRCSGNGVFGPSRGEISCPACSGYDDDCSRCDGDAIITCPDCAGEEVRLCPDCQNGIRSCPDCTDGTRECPDCGGAGSKRCPTCGGEPGDCPQCGGNGQRDCRECRGDGQVACSECDSRGTVSHKRCDGRGEVRCGCGNGRTPCERCEGEGMLVQATVGTVDYDVETTERIEPEPETRTPFAADRPTQTIATSQEVPSEGTPGPDSPALLETTETAVPVTTVEYTLDGETYTVVDYGGTIEYERAPVSKEIRNQRREVTGLRSSLESEIERRRDYLTDRVVSRRRQLQRAMQRATWVRRIEYLGGASVGVLALYGLYVFAL